MCVKKLGTSQGKKSIEAKRCGAFLQQWEIHLQKNKEQRLTREKKDVPGNECPKNFF